MRGRFITLEGIEGVGKSTNVDHVCGRIRDQGIEVISTREPGGTPLAEQVRDLLLHQDEEPMPPMAELLLMFAARAIHVDNHIRRTLDEGIWVVCDRFTDATLAYQGGGRGLSEDTILTLADWVHKDAWPDLTLLLDAPVGTGLRRARQRGAPDRFERERSRFFTRVRQRYLDHAARHPERITVVDASGDIEAVQTAIDARLTPLLQAWTANG